ncbi:N-acyl homoserine lactonase family protein [Terrisporobacter petrolearius]|uniref:N-acyl homoserine lactonase family protein n=1 Tax=Terrisporobacter petrolearius TaxID=1460447 RepID=UPI001D16B881|nr:N-acyl homoserine lactonase family protein [Terrisporobacter petrolearius]MCC3863747.1 N-acyl homoserine lactonase family protein [Terrisporobacter petrolearius]
MSIFSKILKNIGKGLLLIIGLWLLAIMSVVFYMKGINPILLTFYIIMSLAMNTGLLWPDIFKTLSKGKKSRKTVLKFFGIPSLVMFIIFYTAVIFYIQDIPVILGFLSIMAFLLMVIAFKIPGTLAESLVKKSKGSRLSLFGVPAIILLVLTFISVPMIENYRTRLFEQAEEKRIQAIQSATIKTPAKDGKVKVYPLHVGDTILTYGQFYGGFDGWVGLTGYFKSLVNKDTITIPLYTYLIDHPDHGLMMVDAAINWEQANEHDGFYNHNYMVSRLLTVKDEYRLTTEQELQVQVEKLGYKLEDIKTVFMTHSHDDHAGGLRNLPNAQAVISKEDWEKGTSIYPYSFGLVKENLKLFTYDSGKFKSFSKSLDYFGDGSVILLPTPGHSPGHSAVLVQAEGYDFLFMGDTPYTLNHMSIEEVRQLTLGGIEEEKQLESTRNLQKLVDVKPDTVMLFAHDYTDYQSDYIEKFLIDGSLSEEELNNIRDYRFKIFDDKWKLNPGNMPYYVPASGDKETGRVDFK